MRAFIAILCCVGLGAAAQVPTFKSFDPADFSTNGYVIRISSNLWYRITNSIVASSPAQSNYLYDAANVTADGINKWLVGAWTANGASFSNLNATELRAGLVGSKVLSPTNDVEDGYSLTIDHGTNKWTLISGGTNGGGGGFSLLAAATELVELTTNHVAEYQESVNLWMQTNIILNWTATSNGFYTLRFNISQNYSNPPWGPDFSPTAGSGMRSTIFFKSGTYGSNWVRNLYELSGSAWQSDFNSVNVGQTDDSFAKWAMGEIPFYLQSGWSLVVSNYHANSIEEDGFGGSDSFLRGVARYQVYANSGGAGGTGATNVVWPVAGLNVTAETNELAVTINADVGYVELNNALNVVLNAQVDATNDLNTALQSQLAGKVDEDGGYATNIYLYTGIFSPDLVANSGSASYMLQWLPDGRIQRSASGGFITGLNADNLASGTVPHARLPSTATTNAGTLTGALLKGDGARGVTTTDLTGDVTTSGGQATTLASVGTAGTYRSVTTDAKGRVTAGTAPTTFSGYGLIDTSANLASALTDETGTGSAVFQTAPQFITSIQVTNSTTANANSNTVILPGRIELVPTNGMILDGGNNRIQSVTNTLVLSNSYGGVSLKSVGAFNAEFSLGTDGSFAYNAGGASKMFANQNGVAIVVRVPMYVSSGSYTAPAYSFESASSDGMWRIAAGNIGIKTNLTVVGTVTATNGVFGAYGSMSIGTTNATYTPGATTTNIISGYDYRKAFGGIGIVTNSFWVTNAGDYRISFGSAIQPGANNQTQHITVRTNGVDWPYVRLTVNNLSSTAWETGFKETVITLPANAVVSLWLWDSSTTGTASTANLVFNLRPAN